MPKNKQQEEKCYCGASYSIGIGLDAKGRRTCLNGHKERKWPDDFKGFHINIR